MMGVALAHELGHYLLDTTHHSTAGLLRESLSVSDLAHPNPAHLRLTDKQQRRICIDGNMSRRPDLKDLIGTGPSTQAPSTDRAPVSTTSKPDRL
jgi:hypothetical protein